MNNTYFVLCMMLYSITSFSQNASLGMSLSANWNPDTIPGYNDIWGYMDCDGNEFAIMGSRQKIHFFDLANPSNPIEVASFNGGESTTWRDIKTYQNRAYAVSDNTVEGLMIFDLSALPQSISKTYHSNALFNNAHNIFIDEMHGRMYVVGSSVANLMIYDIKSDPDNPLLLLSTSLNGGYVHDLYVRDNIAYCNHLSNGMHVYDFSNIQNIDNLGSVTDYLGTVFNHSSWLSDDGNSLFFCDETHGEPVKTIDVTDVSDMSVLPNQMFESALEAPAFTNSIAHNPLVRGDYIFVSYYHDGVQVFDISNPDSISRMAYYDTEPANTNYNGYQGCWGVYPFLSSGTIIASDINNGLFVLSLDAMNLEPTLDDLLPDATIELSAGPLSCEGDSILLSAPLSGIMSYTWTKDNVVLPVDGNRLVVYENGTYSLEVSNGICSDFSEEQLIQFSTVPDLSVMTGDQVDLCAGEIYMISAPTGFDFYVWMKNGNVLPNTSNTIQATETGMYTLLAYNGGCTSFSAPYNVTFIALPEPILNTTVENPCANETVILETAVGAETYNWYKNGNLVNTTTSPFYTILEDGNYTVQLAMSNCTVTSEEFAVTILPVPVNDILISGSTVLCPGESVLLSAENNNGIESWTWTLDGAVINTTSEIEVNEQGLYELTILGTNGCSDFNQQYVATSELVVPLVEMQGEALISSSATTYQWYLSNQMISGAISQTYVPTEVGMYTVETTNAEGCTALSAPVEVNLVSIETPTILAKASIYPNPTTTNIHFDLNAEYYGEMVLQLYQVDGRLLKEIRKEATGNFSAVISVADFASGIYLLKITNEEGSVMSKVVKR